ncbi:MAG: hypothetical protein H8D95_01010 [Candidatus Endolissoclinum sp.]|nr:hypothetical protein [Candidatus Endolissoclinum sp.]
MAFEIYKMGKLSDRLEEEAYQWVSYQITETYGLELTKNEYGYEQDVVEVMTKDHVLEIEEYLDTTYKDKLWIEPYANTALNSIVDRWRDENDDWDTAVYEVDKLTPKKEDGDEIMPDGYPKTFKVT